MGWRALAVLVGDVQETSQKWGGKRWERWERREGGGKECKMERANEEKETVTGRNGATRWDGQRDGGPGTSNNSRPEVSGRERRRQTQGWMARGGSAVTRGEKREARAIAASSLWGFGRERACARRREIRFNLDGSSQVQDTLDRRCWGREEQEHTVKRKVKRTNRTKHLVTVHGHVPFSFFSVSFLPSFLQFFLYFFATSPLPPRGRCRAWAACGKGVRGGGLSCRRVHSILTKID